MGESKRVITIPVRAPCNYVKSLVSPNSIMTLAEQQTVRIDLNELTQVAVDFSDKPLSTGELTLRTKLFVLGDPDVTKTLINHFLPPYRQQGALRTFFLPQ